MKQLILPVVIAGLVLSMLFFTQHQVGVNQSSGNGRFEEIWKKSQELRDQQSVDTTPVEFTVGDVHYKVPRNYLSHIDSSLRPATFRVTFPGFQPLTEETKQCLTQPRSYWPPGCIPIEFWVGVDSLHLTEDRYFKNQLKRFHGQIRETRRNGFDVYEWSVDNGLEELYRKRTPMHTLIIVCSYYELEGTHNAICSNYYSLLPNGNILSYRLDLSQIASAEMIDDGIRSLLKSFSVIAGRP